MKRPTILHCCILEELGCQLGIATERDVATIRRRVEHEGLSFLTITLPKLSDALEGGIESGFLSCPSDFASHGSLPLLLGGFFRNVFDSSGKLRDDACIDSVFAIRQIARLHKKPKLQCSPARERDALARYIALEGELRSATVKIETRIDPILDQVSGVLWTQVFPEFDPNSLVCRHGPGATAERFRSNDRYTIRQWPTRSELTFPPDLHCYPNYWEAAGFGNGKVLNEQIALPVDIKDEPPVRVVFVPKTLTTPRVIAIEPSHMQYMQQGLMAHVVSTLETHRLTRNSVRFTDQSRNQELAYRSSMDRRLATLDLKDASDRVHLALVRRIFKTTSLLEYLEDSRSMHAILPDGTSVILSKFASMGSAMCFPVEAMVFYTIVQAAIHKYHQVVPTSRTIHRFSADIDIFGDDIIVPVEYVAQIVADLEAYSLKVNINKSFRFSQFRESCGADYFKGVSVKPAYLRVVPEDRRRDWTASTCMSLAATSDQLYALGLWRSAQCLRDMLQEGLATPIPRSRRPGAGLRFTSVLFDTGCRYNNTLHRWEQRRITYEPVRKPDHIDGQAIPCLLKVGLGQRVRHSDERRDRDLYNHDRRQEMVLRSRTWSQLPASLHETTALAGRCLFSENGSLAKLWADTGLLDGAGPAAKAGLDFITSVKRGSFKSKYRWQAC